MTDGGGGGGARAGRGGGGGGGPQGFLTVTISFFKTQSEVIEPVLPQAAQLDILFYISFIAHSYRRASLRDLIKDTPLVK